MWKRKKEPLVSCNVAKEKIWRNPQIMTDAYYITKKAQTSVDIITAFMKDMELDSPYPSEELLRMIKNELVGMSMLSFNIGIGAGIDATIMEVKNGLSV